MSTGGVGSPPRGRGGGSSPGTSPAGASRGASPGGASAGRPSQSASAQGQEAGAATLVEAVKAIAADTAALLRAELELAKAEIASGAQRKALGAGLLALAAALAAVAFLALLVAAGFALSEGAGLPGWASALIIAGVLLVVAVIVALIGRSQLATPVSTKATQQQVSEDMEWVTRKLRESR